MLVNVPPPPPPTHCTASHHLALLRLYLSECLVEIYPPLLRCVAACCYNSSARTLPFILCGCVPVLRLHWLEVVHVCPKSALRVTYILERCSLGTAMRKTTGTFAVSFCNHIQNMQLSGAVGFSNDVASLVELLSRKSSLWSMLCWRCPAYLTGWVQVDACCSIAWSATWVVSCTVEIPTRWCLNCFKHSSGITSTLTPMINRTLTLI